MSTDSTTSGFIAPNTSPAPIEDQDLDRFLQQYVSAITGVSGDLVRPRWQPDPPNQPGIDVTWIALGVSGRNPETFAAELHADDEQSSVTYRLEDLDVLVSFFGPGMGAAYARFRDGLSLAQNREALTLSGFGLIELTPPITAPALLNERWQKRIDTTLRLRRGVAHRYAVLSIGSPNLTITTDH